MYYAELSLATQTAFAGLDTAAKQEELQRHVGHVPGGFALKAVKGKRFWYHQARSADAHLVQTYVGPDDERTRSLIDHHKQQRGSASQQHLQALGKAAVALGCADIPTKHARVIRRLADAGLFAAGGILVGTHAFLAYQNMLGVRWVQGATTLDLDFAHSGRNVSLALPSNWQVQTRTAIESLQMGFLPNISGTTFRKADEPDFDLDFLTVRGRGGEKPIVVAQLGIALQPLRFMDFSMEDTTRSTLLYSGGAIVVNLPNPARYAVHKLLVCAERPIEQRVKANKDVVQAAALMAWHLHNDTAALQVAMRDVLTRGPTWARQFKTGLQRLEAGLRAQVAALISDSVQPQTKEIKAKIDRTH